MKFKFPDNFFWGTSTAFAQIETATDHNWKGVESKDGYTFLRTIDHEKRRVEDAGYIKQFGTVYRCGVDWARLQSAPFADFDLDVVKEYRTFFEDLISGGMEILFVIHHFTNPLWFEENGTWLNEDNIPAFLDFAQKCIDHFSDQVAFWNTFNEPAVYAMNGFVVGNFPPFKKNIFKGNKVLRNMGRAHEITYRMLKKNNPEKQVGISKNTGWFKGTNAIGSMLAKFVDWWFIDYAASHFKTVDFWGVSYYAYVPFTPFPVTEIDNPGKLDKLRIPHDKMWGYYPDGLRQILIRFHKKYGLPIMITENGVCTDDARFRKESMRNYLEACHGALEAGVDLIGYIYWSTFDNFEWNLGPTYRFGLVEVDMDTMERKMTPAGELYKTITQNNGI
ncbi:MAG: family 1 glycosylhydrolase [Bacteroidota bacterium]